MKQYAIMGKFSKRYLCELHPPRWTDWEFTAHLFSDRETAEEFLKTLNDPDMLTIKEIQL